MPPRSSPQALAGCWSPGGGGGGGGELGCPAVGHEDAICCSAAFSARGTLGAPMFDDHVDKAPGALLTQGSSSTATAAALTSRQPPWVRRSSPSFDSWAFSSLRHPDTSRKSIVLSNNTSTKGHTGTHHGDDGNEDGRKKDGIEDGDDNSRSSSSSNIRSRRTSSGDLREGECKALLALAPSTTALQPSGASSTPGSPLLRTFFYATSSGNPSVASSLESTVPGADADARLGRALTVTRTKKMAKPATLTAPGGRASSSSTSNSCQPWRPHSARSSSTSRSASPLLSRLTRKTPGHSQEPSLSARKSDSSSSRGTLQLTPPEVTGVSTTTITANVPRHDEDGGKRKVDHAAEDAAARQTQARAPQMTREEFEALPLAIQRKYFSTLERLRFAQTSGMVDGIYQHYDDITALNVRRRRPRQDRSASDQFARRLRRQSLRGLSHGSYDFLGVQNLQDREQRPVTREDQVALARNLRASVILDAADEAIYKIGRRAGSNPGPDLEVATPALSRRNSMDSYESGRREAEPVQQQETERNSLYESFRWLDEEDDLDLRLFLDDYHANLREDLPVPTKERGPSFRRHLSISKIPFGRSSSISSRPGTKDTAVASHVSPSPASPQGSSPNGKQHVRRRSRTLSLITPKSHARQDSMTINPDAAHYQDPEARLKLRVYLASPQKFDEAIEFGFPSADALGAPQTQTSHHNQDHFAKKRESRQKSADWGQLKTFLDDDEDDEDDDDMVEPASSALEDPASSPDPDSPKTPQLGEKSTFTTIRPMRATPEPSMPHLFHASRPSESYAQAPASSREMTLRMTLTRPDLRANEEQIYGWQPKLSLYPPNRKSQSEVNMLAPKESMEQTFAGIDHWGPDTADRGVMKRFWNKVRRG